MKCKRTECLDVATCAVGVAFYPPKAVMDYYKSNVYLARLVVSLELCDAHFTETVDLGVECILPTENLEAIVALTEKQYGTVIDRKLTKIEPVPLDHPDYVRLQNMPKVTQ